MRDCIVIIGNVVDGFSFYGPFTFDEAHDWGSHVSEEFSIVELTAP